MTFLELALSYAARGWHVFPCVPRTKEPLTKHGWQDATTDTQQITAWWTAHPDANLGIACGASGLVVLDVDHGLASDADAIFWMGKAGMPATYVVRTGRRPEFGLQFYFIGSMRGCDFKDFEGCAGQIRGAGQYVMAAGSIHPDSGKEYTVKSDAPLAPLPSIIANLRKPQAETATTSSRVIKTRWELPVHVDEDRTGFLVEQGGYIRNAGLGYAAIKAHLEELNNDPEIIADPVSEDRLDGVAERASKFEVNVPEVPPVAIVGKPAADPEHTGEDADVSLTGKEQPHYPRHAWAGTIYALFADLCVKGNHIPWKYFCESLRTITGAIVGNRLSSEMYGARSQEYTIQIGPPGSGKGTSEEWAEKVYSEEWNGMTRTNAPLLFGPREYAWRGTGIGAQVGALASAPGLMKMLELRPLKKGEARNPAEIWKPIARVITIQEEIHGLFANFTNESTGAGLESVLCELYDRDSFTSTSTKDRQPERGRCQFSMLGGITAEMWESTFSKASATDSGFLTRVNIVGTERSKRVGGLRAPHLEVIRHKIYPLVLALCESPRVINPDPDAERLMNTWFDSYVPPPGVTISRLNIHAWRAALHIAWLRGHSCMTCEDVQHGIDLAEYLAHMREYYRPPEGESRQARCEQSIRKIMQARKRLSVKELRDRTNAFKAGLDLWDKALKAMERAGELRIHEELGGANKKLRKIAILLKTQ